MVKSPFELAYRYVEPSVKRRLVLKLIEKNIPPIEVSRKLNISPSLVTRYVKGDRGACLELSEYSDVEEMIEKLANDLLMSDMTKYNVQREVSRITMYVLSRKYVCSLHKVLERDVDLLQCNVCALIFR
ncbi:MAG: transcriptional regulator [Desulfurococcaceae archaeon]